MLRKQISEQQAGYAEPILGINLRDSEENLSTGEARLMQNCENYGGIRKRRGSVRYTPNVLFIGSKIFGGIKYYFGGASPQSQRIVALGTRITRIHEDGTETALLSVPQQDAFFSTWSVTDKLYFANRTDTLRDYNGTSIVTTTGTNIPIPRSPVIPVLDRLFCITTNGIERSNPRVDNVWSANSSWATFRPVEPGLFTAIHPFTLRGTDTIYPGMLAFQERAYYHITGTNYGDSVTTASPPSALDASIKLLDSTVGTASPYSICSVPGVGTFWFTTDLNVYWIPEGSLTGRYVGDKLQSTNVTAGIESCNLAAINQVWMAYFDHMLMLGIPTGSNTFATTQFWMDIRSLRNYPDRGPVWYGPMTGQSVGRVWIENQQGDNRIVGGEGDSAVGCFIYKLRQPATFTDAVGTADNPVAMSYQTVFKDFGVPSREKYVQAVHLDLNDFSGTATTTLLDLSGTLAADVPILEVPN